MQVLSGNDMLSTIEILIARAGLDTELQCLGLSSANNRLLYHELHCADIGPVLSGCAPL